MKKYSLLLAYLLLLELGLSSCNLFRKKDPDPLANAAGTYVGTMQDNTAIIQNARANVTTNKHNSGEVYVSSVGITSSTYQVVINGTGGEYLSGSRNGVTYTGRVVVNGQSINITGNYKITTTSPSLTFSYTGTKQ